MRLTEIRPVRDNDNLVGWTARFTDPEGLARLANLGLGSLMDPAAFADAVTRQGVPYVSPCGTDKTAWQSLIRQVTVHSTPAAAPSPPRRR